MNIGKVKTAGDQGTFLYALNKNETNKWCFSLDGGRDDNDDRISCEEEALIAGEIYSRLTSHDALTERVKDLEAALDRAINAACDDYRPDEEWVHEIIVIRNNELKAGK